MMFYFSNERLSYAILIITVALQHCQGATPTSTTPSNQAASAEGASQSWSSLMSQQQRQQQKHRHGNSVEQVSSLSSSSSSSSLSSSLSSTSSSASSSPSSSVPSSSQKSSSASSYKTTNNNRPQWLASIINSRATSWCRQFDDSEACVSNGCCLTNYTVSMKTMRGNRQLRVSECVSKVPENHVCVKSTSSVRQAIDMLVQSSTGRSSASKAFAYLQCPCQDGLHCMTDRGDAIISICRPSDGPPDFMPQQHQQQQDDDTSDGTIYFEHDATR